jgi:epsilon-lactone hydrolase
VKWELPSERPGRAAPDWLLATRSQLDEQTVEPVPAPLMVEKSRIGGVPCVLVVPPTVEVDLLYLHGGGFRMGRPISWLPLAHRLATRLLARGVLPEYRLAPEHPFPAGLHDVANVYSHLRSATAGPLFAAGDSAGGGLAAALTVAAIASNIAPPDALLLLSPWLDLSLEGETHKSRAETDQLFPPARSAEAAGLYVQGLDVRDPLMSPAFADVTRFPRTLILAGSEETLLADSLDFAHKLALAHVGVTLQVGAGRQHAWPAIWPDTPEAAAAIETMGQFAKDSAPSRGTEKL